MLSSIGGLTVLLLRYFTVIVTVFNFKNMDNYLVSQLYQLKDQEKQDKISRNCKECLIELLPKKLICCNKSHRIREIQKARSVLYKEINIV